MFQMLGMVAEWERETIIERTKSGRLQRYKDGCWAGGNLPYGYAYDKTTKKLVIREDTARIIRRIYKEYVDGSSLNRICTSLNEDKVHGRAKRSRGWRPSGIRHSMLNPIYKGTQIVHRFSHISDLRRVDLSKAIQISVPPIVDEQTWNVAQERLLGNVHLRPLTENDFLLQGMIKCGHCGFAYGARRKGNVRYYFCRGTMKSKHIDGSPRCKYRSLRADWLEDAVGQRVKEVINDPNKLAVIITETIETLRMREVDLNARIRPINDRLAEIAEQKTKLADDWVIRHMNNEKFTELRNNLDKEESRMRALKSQIDPAQIAELEKTKEALYYWEKQIKSMVGNTENEDGTMFRQIDDPHEAALKVIGLEDKTPSHSLAFPGSMRELFNKLQLKLVVFSDRIEINALFTMEPIGVQLCTSTEKLGDAEREKKMMNGIVSSLFGMMLDQSGCNPVGKCLVTVMISSC